MSGKAAHRISRIALLLTTISLLCQLILPILHVPLGATAAPIKKVNIFADGTQSKAITLTDMGTDSTTAKLSFQTGVTLANASMLVDGQASGKSYPSNISIDVGGDGDKDWQWAGLGYGGLGHQDLFILDGKAQNATANLTIMGGGGNNDTASIRLPYGAQVTNATLEVEVKGISIAIECKTGSGSCNSLNADPVYYLRDAFLEKGWNVKIVTGTDIDTVAELNQYTVVLLGDAGFNDDDHATFQAALKTWVTENGGGMVGMGWIVYSTTAGTDIEYLLPVNAGYNFVYGTGQVTITNANHPVTQGVNNFNVPATCYCEFPSSQTIDAGAQTLGTCTGPTIVVAQKGAGRTVYLGPTYFADNSNYHSASWYQDANAKKLVQQATLWASGGGSLTGFIDIANDTNQEWSKTGFNGTEGLADFSATLNTYMATAQPSFTDTYGNQFVDVPIRVNSTSAGLISLRNLTVTYTYTAKMEQNPNNVTLAGEINGLIPTTLGTKNITLPIVVSSDTAGIVTLHNFNADIIDPAHAPLITAYEPAKDIVDADENTTVDLKVTATDWYRYPMTYTWFKDEKKNTTGDTYHYYIDFESQGQHNITVVVNNTIQDTARSWTVKVTNVDRPPHIYSYTPDTLQVSMDENTTKTFSVVAKDPDIGDMVGYSWTLDGAPATSTSSNYDYKPTFLDQGVHYLEVTAKNQRQLKTTLKWAITVNDVNAPPEITSWVPKTDPTMAENTTAMFSIKARTPDGDQLTYAWYVDDKPVPKETGTAFKYAADFEDAGVREVKAEVSDGKLSVFHKWSVTVTDVNRPPVAVISSPKDDDEFLTTDNITFSAKGSTDPDKDKLTFEWYEGPMKLGTGETLKVKLPVGHQTVELRVSDGREGLTTTEVQIIVRALRFELTVEPDNTGARAGDSIKLKVHIKSTGDADGTNIPVVVFVDGAVIGNQTIPSIAAGDETDLEFPWTAKEGTHTVKVVMAQDKAEKSISVQPALLPPITPGVKGNNWFLPLLLIIIVIAVFLTVVGVAAAKRRKRAVAAQAQPAVAPAPPVAAPVAQPVVQQSPASAGSYRMVPPPTSQPSQVYAQSAYPPPPPPGYYQARATVVATPPMGMARPVMPEQTYESPTQLPEQPSVTNVAGADIEAELTSADAAIQAAAAGGKDVTRAKNHLRLANFFARKGDSPKAMDYCRKAREAVK